MKTLIEFKNIVDLEASLKDEKTCRSYFEETRWNGKPISPHCGCDKV